MSIKIQPTPKTFEEAVERIYKGLGKRGRKDFEGDISISSLHHGFGTQLRNSWGLWNGSVLRDEFNNRFGLGHADDMSGLILDAVDAKIRNKEFNLDAEVQHYKDFWMVQCIDPLTQQPIPGCKTKSELVNLSHLSSVISRKRWDFSWISKVGSSLLTWLKL